MRFSSRQAKVGRRRPTASVGLRLAAAGLLVSLLLPSLASAQVDFGAQDIATGLVQSLVPGGGVLAPVLPVVPTNPCTLVILCPAGFAITYQQWKSTSDWLATLALKTTISLVRDMVIRWIVTGRFEGPTFVTSFSVDAAKTAENASRIFLSQLTGINFCAGFGVPSPRTFTWGFDFGLTCSLPPRFNSNDFLLYPERYSELDRFIASLPENDFGQTLVRTAQAKGEFEARALVSRSTEYVTGRGFLGIRDELGKIITPGAVVEGLALSSIIESPQRQLDVANTLQQAIIAILETAIRTIVEKGLSGVFGP